MMKCAEILARSSDSIMRIEDDVLLKRVSGTLFVTDRRPGLFQGHRGSPSNSEFHPQDNHSTGDFGALDGLS